METMFISALAAFSALYLVWGMKVLPGERWQIAATLPLHKVADGSWSGINLTWYGILTANAYVAASAIALALMGSAGVSLQGIGAIVLLLLACCVPASRLVAQLVEKKANTFTVGGAVFVGTLLAPWITLMVSRMLPESAADPLAPLAAISIAYAFGEGFGRLACVSFGCCYGKPLSCSPPRVARILAPFALTFTGKTKKIAYGSGLDGVKVLPVQGITFLLYCGAGLVSILLFLRCEFGAAFIVSLIVTQGWRVVSEFFRDDYRGSGRFSAYQVMGLLGIVYGLWATWHFSGGSLLHPELARGLAFFQSPATLLLLQSLWVAIFLYTGLSRVTGVTMRFHVRHEKV